MSTKKTNPNLKRVLINMPVKLLNDLDMYAESMNINRTAAILSLLSQSLNSYKALEYVDMVVKNQKKDDDVNG